MTASDGFEALRMIGGTLPDLVITDLQMPGMSGFELLEVLRERFPQIPVIAVSDEFTGDALPPGVIADVFLSKDGYTTARFAATIKELLAISPMRTAAPESRGSVSHDVTYHDADMRAVLGRLAHDATRAPEGLGHSSAAAEDGRSAWRPSAFATSVE
jgi:DNA-binding NarL/FixJ family response regulator